MKIQNENNKHSSWSFAGLNNGTISCNILSKEKSSISSNIPSKFWYFQYFEIQKLKTDPC